MKIQANAEVRCDQNEIDNEAIKRELCMILCKKLTETSRFIEPASVYSEKDENGRILVKQTAILYAFDCFQMKELIKLSKEVPKLKDILNLKATR